MQPAKFYSTHVPCWAQPAWTGVAQHMVLLNVTQETHADINMKRALTLWVIKLAKSVLYGSKWDFEGTPKLLGEVTV